MFFVLKKPLSGLQLGLFTNVLAKWSGSTHDSFVSTNSLIHERLESNHAFERGRKGGSSAQFTAIKK